MAEDTQNPDFDESPLEDNGQKALNEDLKDALEKTSKVNEDIYEDLLEKHNKAVETVKESMEGQFAVEDLEKGLDSKISSLEKMLENFEGSIEEQGINFSSEIGNTIEKSVDPANLESTQGIGDIPDEDEQNNLFIEKSEGISDNLVERGEEITPSISMNDTEIEEIQPLEEVPKEIPEELAEGVPEPPQSPISVIQEENIISGIEGLESLITASGEGITEIITKEGEEAPFGATTPTEPSPEEETEKISTVVEDPISKEENIGISDEIDLLPKEGIAVPDVNVSIFSEGVGGIPILEEESPGNYENLSQERAQAPVIEESVETEGKVKEEIQEGYDAILGATGVAGGIAESINNTLKSEEFHEKFMEKETIASVEEAVESPSQPIESEGIEIEPAITEEPPLIEGEEAFPEEIGAPEVYVEPPVINIDGITEEEGISPIQEMVEEVPEAPMLNFEEGGIAAAVEASLDKSEKMESEVVEDVEQENAIPLEAPEITIPFDESEIIKEEPEPESIPGIIEGLNITSEMESKMEGSSTGPEFSPEMAQTVATVDSIDEKFTSMMEDENDDEKNKTLAIAIRKEFELMFSDIESPIYDLLNVASQKSGEAFGRELG